MKFADRARRRRAGIYLVRTRKHGAVLGGKLGIRENGYVGRSNYVHLRRLCHLGMCKHRQHAMKDWGDLEPVWWTLQLPWWLSWKWVQVIVEAFAIWLLLPRYNTQLNTKNPRRVTSQQQKIQRAARDRVRSIKHGVPTGEQRMMGINR